MNFKTTFFLFSLLSIILIFTGCPEPAIAVDYWYECTWNFEIENKTDNVINFEFIGLSRDTDNFYSKIEFFENETSVLLKDTYKNLSFKTGADYTKGFSFIIKIQDNYYLGCTKTSIDFLENKNIQKDSLGEIIIYDKGLKNWTWKTLITETSLKLKKYPKISYKITISNDELNTLLINIEEEAIIL